MQKIIVALFAISILGSCDYSTSSNGNIDAAFARETKPNADAHGHNTHDEHGTKAAGHKEDSATDHVETQATQDKPGQLVVPTDTSETVKEHTEHH